MGRVTYGGVEVIPVENAASQLPDTANVSRPKPEDEEDSDQSANSLDAELVPRVQKYLGDNIDKIYITIDGMADEIQRSYREYSHRKQGAFRTAVKQAYAAVLQQHNMDEQRLTSSDDLTDCEGDLDRFRMGTGRKRPLLPKPVDPNELIDISSDDSDEGGEPKQTPENGPSTSHDVRPEDLVEAELKLRPAKGRKRKFDGRAGPSASTKRKKTVASLEESFITFKDVAGMAKILEEVCEVLLQMRHPEVYRRIGIPPPRGILLGGPPGCGKTLLANAIAGELEVPLLKVSASELIHGVVGESEERIRELFEKALVASPCVLFIDEIDILTRTNQKEQKPMHQRILSQLLSSLDDLSKNCEADQVLVVAATNKPESLDPNLKRIGRFDKEISFSVPDYESRVQLIKLLTSRLKLAEGVVLETIAEHTKGYVGSDLVCLIREAVTVAIDRAYTELREKSVYESPVEAEKLKNNIEEKQTVVEENKKEIEKPEGGEDEEVVDVETPDKKEEKAEAATSDAVVIIDDDVKDKQPNDVPNDNSPSNLMEDVESKSRLDELLSWVHKDVPIKQEKRFEEVRVTMEDFGRALKVVRPTLCKEGFTVVPDVTWNDVGALTDARQELQLTVLGPARFPKQFKSVKNPNAGILLCGPPGCGKTLLAKAIANEAGINFLSIKGPELYNLYTTEPESAVEKCFSRARHSSPCILFLDEFDILCPRPLETVDNFSSARLANQIVYELDYLSRQDVLVLASTNHPDNIDPTVLTRDRLRKVIYVDLPSDNDRVQILRVITRDGTDPVLAMDVDLEAIAKSDKCEGFTGADLLQLVEQATMESIKEIVQSGDREKVVVVTTEHFKRAILKVRPTLSEKDLKHYEKLKKAFGSKFFETEGVEEMEYN